MEVIIMAILVIILGRSLLQQIHFFRQLRQFVEDEKDDLLPNLSFNVELINEGVRLVLSILYFKVFLFLLISWLFISVLFREQFIFFELYALYFFSIFLIPLVIFAFIIVKRKFYNKRMVYYQQKVYLSGWNYLSMKAAKDELKFYLHKDELAIVGKFEVKESEEKNKYWQQFSEEEDND